MDGGAWQAAVHGVAKSRTRLSDFTFIFAFLHWRRQWQHSPVFLPGESQGRGSLVGCRLWGRTEPDTTEVTQQQHLPTRPGALHPGRAKYTFFSSAYGTFSRSDHVLGYKTSLNMLKMIAIMQNMFSNHNGKKLELYNRRKFGKLLNMWDLNNILLDSQWVKRKIIMETRKFS